MIFQGRQASEIDVHRGLWETPEPHALPVSRPRGTGWDNIMRTYVTPMRGNKGLTKSRFQISQFDSYFIPTNSEKSGHPFKNVSMETYGNFFQTLFLAGGKGLN